MQHFISFNDYLSYEFTFLNGVFSIKKNNLFEITKWHIIKMYHKELKRTPCTIKYPHVFEWNLKSDKSFPLL